MRVNTDILKMNVSVLDVAKYLNMDMKVENGKIFSTCPGNHGSKSGKSFVLEKDRFKCWNCGLYGNAITLFMEKTGLEFVEAIKRMATEMCPNAIESNNRPLLNLSKKYRDIQKEFVTFDEKVKKGLEGLLTQRNLDKSVLKKYEIGYSKSNLESIIDIDGTGLSKNNFYFTSRRMTIPIKSHGEVIGFTMRKISKKEDNIPKYYNITKTPYEKWLWGYHFKMKEVVICEGVFDAITVKEYGYEAVATLGTAISRERIENVLKGTKRIYLMFDNDEAGENAIEQFFFNNPLDSEVFVCKIPNHDPDGCSKEEIDNSIANAVEIKKHLISKNRNLNEEKRFLRKCEEKLDKLTYAYVETEMVAKIKKKQVEIFIERSGFLKPFFELKYDGNRIFTGTFNECNRFEYEYKKSNPEIKDYSLFSRVESTQDRLNVIEKKILSAVNNLLNGKVDKSSEIEINNMNEGV